MRTKITILILMLYQLLTSYTAQAESIGLSDVTWNQELSELHTCSLDPVIEVMTQCPGALQRFGFYMEGVEELKIMGGIGPEDIATIWRSSYLGSLTVLNLEETQFIVYRGPTQEGEKGEIISKDLLPDFSFFHPEEQIDSEEMAVAPIKLEKLVCSVYQTTIGKFAYAYATNLREVTFPDWGENVRGGFKLQYIGDGAFIGCSKLPKLELSPEVLEIGAFAFKDCTSLSYVSLPASLVKIGDKGFKDCAKIASIYCQAAEPPVCAEINEERGEGTFIGVPADAEILVPVGSKEVYENAPGWSHFTNIQEYDFTALDNTTVESAGSSAPAEVYNLSGMRVGTSTDALEPGLYLVRRGEQVEKIAVK